MIPERDEPEGSSPVKVALETDVGRNHKVVSQFNLNFPLVRRARGCHLAVRIATAEKEAVCLRSDAGSDRPLKQIE